jgi:hypothetical protein
MRHAFYLILREGNIGAFQIEAAVLAAGVTVLVGAGAE